MIVGIISDTHDNLPNIEKAVNFFNEKKVDFVIHAGDFVAPFSVLRLKKLQCPWSGVFGNNDGEKLGLINVSEGKIFEPPLRLKLDNKKITVVHDLNKLDVDNENAHVIIYGHTHISQTLKKNNKLIINPGECCAWITDKSTVALLDLSDFSVQTVVV